MSRNGKGDSPRPVNQEVYEANWTHIFRKEDNIFRKNKRTKKNGTKIQPRMGNAQRRHV
jgi:hypothetical protein